MFEADHFETDALYLLIFTTSGTGVAIVSAPIRGTCE